MAKRSSTPCPRSDFISAEPKRWGSGSPGTFLPYTGGVDCPGGATNNMAYLMAVEKLAEIEVPPRAKVIRVMLAELSRIMSHLAWCGTLELGPLSPVFSTFNDRERAFDIVDAVCGGRMHPN
jgi:NADH-quinone oxidoreductase subunit C/D